MTEERLCWLGFSGFEAIGPKRFALLRKYFGSARKAWQAKRSDFLATGLSVKIVDQFLDYRKSVSLEDNWQKILNFGARVFFVDQKDYPANLKTIPDPPYVLYCWGEIKKEDQSALAVVGTRKMTHYGQQVTQDLVDQIVGAGLTVVSGLARGIDSTAHQATIKNKGRTIAVLGSGLDWIYPAENKLLAKKIASGFGVVLSEYPLGTRPWFTHFPRRNRIISGLSLGTLVIEGAEKSGSLITARLAAEQGREVFTIPGPIYHPATAGPAHLLKLGAKLVLTVDDILDELSLPKKEQSLPKEDLTSKDEQVIINSIANEPKHLNEIARETGWSVGKVTSLLVMLEMKGLVKDRGGLRYGI
ncbi:DNA-processing protein DprA [Patescibacteria group bacterium]